VPIQSTVDPIYNLRNIETGSIFLRLFKTSLSFPHLGIAPIPIQITQQTTIQLLQPKPPVPVMLDLTINDPYQNLLSSLPDINHITASSTLPPRAGILMDWEFNYDQYPISIDESDVNVTITVWIEEGLGLKLHRQPSFTSMIYISVGDIDVNCSATTGVVEVVTSRAFVLECMHASPCL
jgi:hypothetical protein